MVEQAAWFSDLGNVVSTVTVERCLQELHRTTGAGPTACRRALDLAQRYPKEGTHLLARAKELLWLQGAAVVHTHTHDNCDICQE